MFKCSECSKEVYLLYFLRAEEASQKMDKGEYCEKCFNIKFEEKNDKDNKKRA